MKAAEAQAAPAAGTEPALEVRGLSVRFGESGRHLDAVRDAWLEVGQGEIVGLIGESGSGKTTLAHALLGLVRGGPGIWAGEARLAGSPLLPDCAAFCRTEGDGEATRVRKRQAAFDRAHRRLLAPLLGRDVAAIFQEPKGALDPYFTVGQHLLEAIRRRPGLEPGAQAGYGRELLREVGLEPAGVWGLYSHQISGGMAQRVMIAMALGARPKLLVADEPSTALDVTTQAKLLELFRRLREERGLSILLISHDLGVVREACGRVYVMHRGRLVEHGAAAGLMAAPRHPYTAGLLGAFARFGEAAPRPAPVPPGGCPYRGACAAYARALDAEGRARCEGEAPPPRAAAADGAWAACHFPDLSKEARGTLTVTATLPAGAARSGSLLEVEGARKRFARGGGAFTALDGVSLAVGAGETYGLVGESGSGKSTLGLSVLALQPLDGGRVRFEGRDVFALGKGELRQLRRRARMLFQHPDAVLNSGMTVRRILEEALEGEGAPRGEGREARLREALSQARLEEGHLARYPANLSAGEKQRVTIARALMRRPTFLVCDEPVASLDLSIQSQVMALLRELQRSLGLSYLFISHNLALVRLLADRIGVLYMGKLVEEADAADFRLDRVRHPYTRLLLASAPGADAAGEAARRSVLAEYPDVEPGRPDGGCPFRPRCPWYARNPLAACAEADPSLAPAGGSGQVACHQAQDPPGPGATVTPP